ncbi:right-handed parallel beta-helix repeat-containing protein [Sphingomonas aracearum]|uniref:Right-handed parallel beta-helix repeat-containing protein n=1 Tax=Sphingomonas aracearum TaxID=2283317 RepID=A0A369VQH7_9SPHN|nr:right-handed parallel beta-helix repeat-containing protein [Sphingomonas aracearum]RDE04648.1 right-handed parallel beta-helix repeat-containing protein [Sphingomonas aracearum]
MKWIAWVLMLAAATPATAKTFHVAPDGSDAAAGTAAAPFATFARAQEAAGAGDTVLFHGGRYAIVQGANRCPGRTGVVNAVALGKSGQPGQPIRYLAAPGERPVFDFAGMKDDCRVKGITVSGDWIELNGLEITGVPQNNNLNHESWGVWISGSHNRFERLNIHHIMGAGLFIADGGDNLVLNSDSHDNYDPLTSNGAGESGDGFGAHIKAGHPGNVFRGCRAWSNSDDGFDLIRAYSPVLIEHSWSWHNGYIPGSDTPSKNGNGFKMGGYGLSYAPNGAVHTLRFSVAFGNRASGVYANHHPLANEYYSNTSFDNGTDFNMLGIGPDSAPRSLGRLRNNLAFGGTLTANMSDDAAGNSWTLPVTVDAGDFEAVSAAGWDAPRGPDGSLPVLRAVHLRAGTDLVDAGTPVGLPFRGKAPDLGAFER